jgi:hypothetical protein
MLNELDFNWVFKQINDLSFLLFNIFRLQKYFHIEF